MTLVYETFKLPYYRAIPQGLYTGLVVRLEGFIPPHSKWFDVDFLCGQYLGADVSLKFRLRFEGPPPLSSAIVTLNSYAGGQWGQEDKTRSTLRQGQRFTMQFVITSAGYKIIENDRLLWERAHHVSPQRTRFLELKGDITLKDVAFK